MKDTQRESDLSNAQTLLPDDCRSLWEARCSTSCYPQFDDYGLRED